MGRDVVHAVSDRDIDSDLRNIFHVILLLLRLAKIFKGLSEYWWGYLLFFETIIKKICLCLSLLSSHLLSVENWVLNKYFQYFHFHFFSVKNKAPSDHFNSFSSVCQCRQKVQTDLDFCLVAINEILSQLMQQHRAGTVAVTAPTPGDSTASQPTAVRLYCY